MSAPEPKSPLVVTAVPVLHPSGGSSTWLSPSLSILPGPQNGGDSEVLEGWLMGGGGGGQGRGLQKRKQGGDGLTAGTGRAGKQPLGPPRKHSGLGS